MNKSESLRRAAECTRLLLDEATSDPEMQAYLLKLGLSWMQVAAELDECQPKDTRRLREASGSCRLAVGSRDRAIVMLADAWRFHTPDEEASGACVQRPLAKETRIHTLRRKMSQRPIR
jgi:hypothetical protein